MHIQYVSIFVTCTAYQWLAATQPAPVYAHNMRSTIVAKILQQYGPGIIQARV
jgi:hypothetical protein